MKINRKKELTMVFSLENTEEPFSTISTIKSDIRMQPRIGTISHLDALSAIVDVMHGLGLEEKFDYRDKLVSADFVLDKLRKGDKWGRIQTAGLSFQFGIVAGHDYCFVSIEETIAGAAICWDKWLQPFLFRPGFVQAWLSDWEYRYWQNVKDPKSYELAKRDYRHLPMKSNGFPAPLHKMEIDISQNPGRYVLRNGYIEAVADIMWLGKLFWSRVGVEHKNRLRSTEWVSLEEMSRGVDCIQVLNKSFIDESTGDMQDELRAILYAEI